MNIMNMNIRQKPRNLKPPQVPFRVSSLQMYNQYPNFYGTPFLEFL